MAAADLFCSIIIKLTSLGLGAMGQGWQRMIFQNDLNDVSSWDALREGPRQPPNEDLGQEQLQQFLEGLPPKKAKSHSKRMKHFWTAEENLKLQKLHDDFGNKWCIISTHFETKSQNDVKNHFFSQLRMSLRHLNKLTGREPQLKMKPIKAGIIYKVISTCEQRYRKQSSTHKQIINLCFKIKHGLFSFFDHHQDKQREQTFLLAGYLKSFSLMICRNAKGKNSKLTNEFEPSEAGEPFELSRSFSVSDIFDEGKHQKSEIYSFTSVRISEDVSQEAMRDIDESQLKPEETSGLIARPEICLLNPFEQINFPKQEEGGAFFSFYKEDSAQCLPLYLWNHEPIQFGSL